MQKRMMMSLVMSAALAASCATMHRSMLTGVNIWMGTGAVASMAAMRKKGAAR